jgi:uncharacterized protein
MSRIPVSLDPFLPRALERRWEGEYSGDDLPRLRAASPDGAVISVRVAFTLARGPLGEIRWQAEIEGETDQVCQRCLQPMRWHFRLQPDIALVRPDDRPSGLGEDAERLELGADGLLWPAAAVEDEILLVLPLAPRHEQCSTGGHREFEPGEGDREAENPFAVLGQLRGKS